MINRPVDFALDSLGLNKLSVQIVGFSFILMPIFLLVSMICFIYHESAIKKQFNRLPDEVHNHSAWYIIYAHLYRLSFFVTEPATTGFFLAVLFRASYDTKYMVSLFGILFSLFYVVVGLFQSCMYLQFAESVLPGNTLLSATTKTHLFCISVLPKL